MYTQSFFINVKQILESEWMSYGFHVILQIYMELEQGKNVDFWRDMTTITEDEISKLRKLEASGKGPGTVNMSRANNKSLSS